MNYNFQDNTVKEIDGDLKQLCSYLISQNHEPHSIKIDLDIIDTTDKSSNIKNIFEFLLDLLIELLRQKYNINKLSESFEKLEHSELQFIISKFAAIGIKINIDILENIYNTEYLENIEQYNNNINDNNKLPDLESNNIEKSDKIENQKLSSHFISLKHKNNSYKIYFDFL